MPKDTRGKVTLTPEAYKVLEVESMLMRVSLKEAAYKMIVKGACPKRKEILEIMERPPKGSESHTELGTKGPIAQTPSSTKRQRLSKNQEAISRLKELWVQNPRPSMQKIAEDLGYPKITVTDNIERKKANGELSKSLIGSAGR